MSNKAGLTNQQITINRFAFCLLKHFSTEKIKVQGFEIKIHCDQLCSQDFLFLVDLSRSLGDEISLNACRSGKGVCVLIGVANVNEIPEFLVNYQRGAIENVNLSTGKAPISNEQYFKDCATPLMNFLKENHHPHVYATVDSEGAMLIEGLQTVKRD